MKSVRAIIGAITIASTLAFSSIAVAAPSQPNPTAKANANSNAAFWTSDKINGAQAFDMVFDTGASVGRRVPAARAAGGSSSTAVVGTRWTSQGLAATATGKVFFTIGANMYVCSGSLVKDGKADRSVVLTAGHCVYDNATSAYVTNFIFVANYDLTKLAAGGCSASVNCWSASNLYAHSGFTSQTSYTKQATWYDWGFAVIKSVNSTNTLADGGDLNVDGNNSFVIAPSTALSSGTTVYAFGYPQASPYTGLYLIYSSGKLFFDSNNGNKTYGLASDLTGGASGGPWFSGFSTTSASGTISSVNSYKYGTQKYMYGPKFNNYTAETYAQALTN